MNRVLLTMLALGLSTSAVYAIDNEDEAYLAFQRALGEASWINSSADHSLADTAFRPIPAPGSFRSDPAKQQLGFIPFHDARLSSDNMVACSSCHLGMLGGTDRLPVSRGIQGRPGTRNAPTVFNSAFNFRQFWDGRAFTLDEQALGPLSNPVEMGHDLETVVSFVASDPSYARQFAAIYPDGVTAANIGNAIAQHSRDMTRSDSRFNAFLNGDANALSAQEQRGLERFKALGCSSCHNGINVGGNSYQRVTNTTGFFAQRPLQSADDGLLARSGREQDRHVFKVPSLNNVALTAPYYHDGSVQTLYQAVKLMIETQAGRQSKHQDVEDIVTFLHSLSSESLASHGPGMGGRGMGDAMQHQQPMNHQGHHGQHHRMGLSPRGALMQQGQHGGQGL